MHTCSHNIYVIITVRVLAQNHKSQDNSTNNSNQTGFIFEHIILIHILSNW